MPVRFALPLPGPFYWVSGRRKAKLAQPVASFRSRPAYWLLGGWVIEASLWITVAVVVASCYLGWLVLKFGIAGLLWCAGTGWQLITNWRSGNGKHRA